MRGGDSLNNLSEKKLWWVKLSYDQHAAAEAADY